MPTFGLVMCESEELLFIQGCYVVRAKTSLETLKSVAEAKSNRLPDKTVSSEGLHSRQIAPTARTGPPKGGPGAYDLLAALLEPFDRDLEKMRNHPECLTSAPRGARRSQPVGGHPGSRPTPAPARQRPERP